MGIAVAGTLCVCLSGGSLPEPSPLPAVGIAARLLAGLCYATHYPFTRWQQRRHPTSVIFTWMLAGGALALLPVLVLLTGGPPHLGFPVSVGYASAATGLLCTWLPFVCYGEALKRTSLVRAVIISELEPALSVIWVWLAFGERFGTLGAFGSALIIASVLALSLGKAKE